MDWRDAPKYIGRLVIYTDNRGEDHLYILKERRKDRAGRIFAIIQDLRVKNSYVRVSFDKISPVVSLAEGEDDEQEEQFTG